MSYYELMVFKWMGFAILGGCTLLAIFFVLIEMASFRADFAKKKKKKSQHNDVSLNSRN